MNASEGKKVPVGEISAGQLPSLVAGRHFPLCMTVMYERLASEHHLKHWGLQQFSLFLKSIGLPMEQALLFFRQQFSPRSVLAGAGVASPAPGLWLLLLRYKTAPWACTRAGMFKNAFAVLQACPCRVAPCAVLHADVPAPVCVVCGPQDHW